MVHDQVGHLGIFVSSQIANREHSEVASTLKTIEALAPGLYEMRIENVAGPDHEKHFTVGFVERTLDDIRALDDGVNDERSFAAVARASEYQAQAYEMFARPLVQAAVTDSAAAMGRALHPQRLSRALMSSRNPVSAVLEGLAENVRAEPPQGTLGQSLPCARRNDVHRRRANHRPVEGPARPRVRDDCSTRSGTRHGCVHSAAHTRPAAR